MMSVAVLVCLLLAIPAAAQSLTTSSIRSASASAWTIVPDFASMSASLLTQDYTVEQLRRFPVAGGQVVTVRERLEVVANGTTEPDFALTFLTVVGEPAGSALNLEWQANYDRYGSLFVRLNSFSVRDLTRASGNYVLHDFGAVMRAGRVARRMVVFPAVVDKAIWVVDIDALTSVPLFVAEFDNQLKLHAEIEVQSFTSSVQGSLSPTQSTQVITPVPDFQAALAVLGANSSIVDPVIPQMADYGLDRMEVHDDPLSGQRSLLMRYTDGVDQFLVMQNIATLDPFAVLTVAGSGPPAIGHSIARFRDPSLSALVFWSDAVTFHVQGRGSLRRLDDLAVSIYRQVLSN